MKKLVIFMLRIYQGAISPFLGPACRFIPSCSAYCIEGIAKKGVLKGAYLGLRRLLRCHPFHQGGWDPIQ